MYYIRYISCYIKEFNNYEKNSNLHAKTTFIFNTKRMKNEIPWLKKKNDYSFLVAKLKKMQIMKIAREKENYALNCWFH